MKIGIIGTGQVGRSHGEKLISLGHQVMMGTRDVEKTLAKTEPDEMGPESFAVWQKTNPQIKLGTFSEAAQFGELVFDVLKGEVALEVLQNIPKKLLAGKILIDVANALDFSKGMPPTLLISNTESLGERIQAALPEVRVVKSFNTINAHLQTHPEEVADADHTIFLSGNDASAKMEVRKLIESYGWKDILDLGDISTARGTEMLLPLWLRIWNALGTAKFNFKIVR